MLRRSLRYSGPTAKFSMPGASRGSSPAGTSGRSGPAPMPRRAAMHATSNYKKGRDRFDLKDALKKDRERIERNKALPWRERLEDLKVYPWKFFIVFMVLWSWLGTYVVPYMKGDMKSNLPPDVRRMRDGEADS